MPCVLSWSLRSFHRGMLSQNIQIIHFEHITCQLCCLKTMIITSEYQECASTSIHMDCVMNSHLPMNTYAWFPLPLMRTKRKIPLIDRSLSLSVYACVRVCLSVRKGAYDYIKGTRDIVGRSMLQSPHVTSVCEGSISSYR